MNLESDTVFTKELARLIGETIDNRIKKFCKYVVQLDVFGGQYFSPLTVLNTRLQFNTQEQLKEFVKKTFGEVQIYHRWSTERAVYKNGKLVMAFRYYIDFGELIKCLENQFFKQDKK